MTFLSRPTRTTRAAEGLDRRAFTVDEIYRMDAAGIFGPDEKFELIDGEIVPMQAKNHPHERIKSALTLAVARALPDDLWLGIETSIRLTPFTMVEPDLAVYPRHLRLEEVRGPDIVIAIEVAHTTLGYDLALKGKLYGERGIREYWVVDVEARVTHLHRAPAADGIWTELRLIRPEEPLTIAALPGFRVALGEID